MYRGTFFFSLLFGLLTVANAQTTVTGTLLGSDGKPMPVANVVLKVPMNNSPVQVVQVDREGNYAIKVDSTGLWLLDFAGLYHQHHEVAFYTEKPGTVNLNVRLKTYDYLDDFSKVSVVGSFNGWSRQTAVPMVKQADGKYYAVIETNADSVAYRLENVIPKGMVEGTQADSCAFDGYIGYNSIVHPEAGKVEIVFDPTKLVRSNEPARIIFADSLSVEAKFAAIYDEMMGTLNDYMKAFSDYRKSGKDMEHFRYQRPELIKSLLERITQENVPILRQELYRYYLLLAPLTGEIDSATEVKSLAEIPPSSSLWTIIPSQVFSLILYDAEIPAQLKEDYIKRVLEENPNAEVKATILLMEFRNAKYAGDEKKAAVYYDELVNKYGSTQSGKTAKERYSAETEVAVGKALPAFSFRSLGDSTKLFTNETFRGKYLMIDFWATWCGPCVGEVPYIEKAYQRFKDKNFEILSISLDQSPQDVAKFRKDKSPMPWLQAFLGMSNNSKVLKEFDVVGIPHPILVDPTGKVIATNMELRGENLESTLEKYLKK